MIPLAQITQWRNTAPWPDDMQVEQDLILSRILVEIFSHPLLRDALAFRGGTALHKLFFNPPARYSEDIDLVRTSQGPIKEIAGALQGLMTPWLGESKSEQTHNSFKLKYTFNPEGATNTKLRVKIEINIREYYSCFDRISKPFEIHSNWFTGKTDINTFEFFELIATKLRALYQRKKGRDLFDLWLAINHSGFDAEKTIDAFKFYMSKEGNVIRRADYLKNIDNKLQDSSFLDDIKPLLSPALQKTKNKNIISEGWCLQDAAEEVKEKILIYLPE